MPNPNWVQFKYFWHLLQNTRYLEYLDNYIWLTIIIIIIEHIYKAHLRRMQQMR